MKKNKLVGKIIDYALNILIVILAIFLLVSMYTAFQVKILGNEYSNFFGYSLFEVQTGSMHGTIESGDWIIVKTSRDVNIGDIVTYKHGNDFITHRIIESYKGTYVTKGDANNTKDDPIDQSQIVGRVVKTLHGFGILRKTIFNPFVILFLIVSLYLFNLTFKSGKSKFDLKVEEIINVLKELILKKKKVLNNTIKSEKVKVTIESPNEVTQSEKMPSNIITVINDNNSFDNFNKSNSSGVSDTISENNSIENNNIKKDSDIEDELSKTAMFRMISIQPEKDDSLYKETSKITDEEVVDVDDLSKTSVFRIISADSHDVDIKESKIALEEKEKYTEVVNLTLNAEEVDTPVVEKKITREYINERIKSRKAKNIIDKAFIIKKILYDEILNVLLKDGRVYIYKSNMRNEFIDEYMNLKFFSFDSDRKNIKKNIESFGNDLISRFVRDEKKVNIVRAYMNCFLFISSIEDKKNYDIAEELDKFFDFDDEGRDNVVYDIEQIMSFCKDNLTSILEKLDTSTFEIKYNKIVGQKNLYGVQLNHNISFSKVYSDYIVDKTYSEGIISEDKLAVLLNMLLCKIVTDLMKFDYDSTYIVYIPNALYGKDKKLDKIISIIDNEYAKSHIYFLTSVSNMLKNKDDIKRLRKKGYGFAVAFNKPIELKNDDMGYVYMADYYFMDSYLDASNICSSIPSDIIKKIIKDNISKKIGDYGGE